MHGRLRGTWLVLLSLPGLPRASSPPSALVGESGARKTKQEMAMRMLASAVHPGTLLPGCPLPTPQHSHDFVTPPPLESEENRWSPACIWNGPGLLHRACPPACPQARQHHLSKEWMTHRYSVTFIQSQHYVTAGLSMTVPFFSLL